jgi:siroheme synthase
VFGRGGEEALACTRAGVPFEVVPGVSSAIAAPAATGIPVTHRGVASSFAVVTATLEGGTDNEVTRVAASVDTLVVLMAAGRLERLCGAVVEAGRDPHEPAAVVQWATTPEQRTVAGTLATLPDLAAREGIGAPATLVIGPVVEVAFVLGASSSSDGRPPSSTRALAAS